MYYLALQWVNCMTTKRKCLQLQNIYSDSGKEFPRASEMAVSYKMALYLARILLSLDGQSGFSGIICNNPLLHLSPIVVSRYPLRPFIPFTAFVRGLEN